MELCTNLQQRVLDLEKTKTTQAEEIATRVESSGDEEDLGEDASKQGRISDIDADAGITLVIGDEVVVESEVAIKAGEKRNVVEEVVDVIDAASTIPVSIATITDVEITLAQALAELKSAKPKTDKVMIQEPEQKEERLAREKAQQIKEANIAWDDVQAKVEAGYQLAQRL
ncbi:hypothetical protein Tco_1178927 [Tanacetum coccineum]